ncbi:MAG TPA: GNAT family N-acetyltransferase [Thermoleophilaceae bacterium]|nr:GNAT family N-acetyltransferase [Thermoleophilaceae bacterium]
MWELVDRMRRLEHRVHDAGALRRVEFPGGVAYYNHELPLVWDVNFVRVDRPAVGLVGDVERLQARQGHYKVLIEDPAVLAAHSPELIGRGFARRDLVALAREPGGRLHPDVREVPYEDVKPLRFAVHMEQLSPPRADVAHQVGRVHDRTHGLTGERWFVVFADGEPAGHLIAYSDAGLAQIEDVGVLKRFRGRGLARRLLEHALEVVATDHDTVFITAETDDWPQTFYRRLGFEHVEDRADFLLLRTKST